MAKRKSQPERHNSPGSRAVHLKRATQAALSERLAEANFKALAMTTLAEDLANALAAIVTAWEVNRTPEVPARDLKNPFEHAKELLPFAFQAIKSGNY